VGAPVVVAPVREVQVKFCKKEIIHSNIFTAVFSLGKKIKIQCTKLLLSQKNGTIKISLFYQGAIKQNLPITKAAIRKIAAKIDIIKIF